MSRTLEDDVRELGQRLIRQHRLGLPSNVDDLVLDTIEMPQPIVQKPFDPGTLVEIKDCCCRCGKSVYYLVPPELVKEETSHRTICNSCAAWDKPDDSHAFAAKWGW